MPGPGDSTDHRMTKPSPGVPRREREEGDPAFRPAWALRGAFRQTVLGAFLPARYGEALPPAEVREVTTEGVTLRAFVTPPRGVPKGRLLLLHGLGGSATSRYMFRTLDEAWHRGWEVARANFRGAEGGSATPTFHNAQRSDDVAALVAGLEWTTSGADIPLVVVGYSLGGALALRYLALAGDAAPIAAAAAVSPPIDLAACLASLERPRNAVYHRYYVHRQRLQIGRLLAEHPGRWRPLDARASSVRELDRRYVAPDAGYDSPEAYYAGASARPILSRIARPTLILTSEDDPIVPHGQFDELRGGVRNVALLATRAGGHCGYLGGGLFRGLSFWAAGAILDWLDEAIRV